MPIAAPDLDVLIVGAGPVGLFLANECARRGLTWRLVETRPSQSEHSKALAIFPRTLEIFDMAGLVGPFVDAANPVTSVAIFSHGRPLAHMRFAPEESPFRFIAMVPQNVTERLLADALRRKGGTVDYETSFVSAVQERDRVNTTLDHKGERIESSARFVVGCDGAHSTVRHLLDLPFEGQAYDASFLLADVQTNETLPGNEMQLCPSELGPLAIFPMSATRRRIVATIDQAEGEAPSLQLVQRILRERAPVGIEALDLHWSSYFRIHHRHCAKLSVGRIFVAGDAAHIHSPFGGQGMNTGLQDVWNLAWKLDLAVHGRAGDELLESYNSERLPVIKQVIQTTHFLTKAMGTPNRFAQALRDTVIPMVSRLAPFQHAFVERLSELGIAYRGSPIVEGAGKRYFSDSIRGGNGIRSRFLLLCDNGEEAGVMADATRLAESFHDVLELREGSRGEVTLVRPDGYIAYSAHRHDLAGALESVRSVLEQQTRRSDGSAAGHSGKALTAGD
jgi:2-polyprenyl-6-methoxyphenol hydroxylase-like FAD-dependent oxidoreductase